MASSKGKWFLIITVIVLVLGGLYGAAFFLASDGGQVASDYDEEVLIEGDSGDKIAMISVVGEIFSDPEGIAEGASDSNIITQLDRADDDDSVRGVIIQLETPGGGVVASDAIYNRVKKLSASKPVVALMGDVAASGGYYIAAGADEIVAHPATWTGSIGVIALLPNFEKAADKIGVSVTVFKSGAFKDAGSPFRALKPEEQVYFQALIDEAYGGFVEVVADGRKIDVERVKQIADGRVYSGKQAKELGLVDRLGDQDLAFARAKKLAKAPGATLVRYSNPASFNDLLGVTSRLTNKDLIKQELGLQRRPGAAYLWLP